MKCPCFVEAFLKYLSENQVLADWTVPVKHRNIQAWGEGKSSCKITPCMHFLRQFKSSFRMYLRCAGERIISVCCETGLYPGAGDQPQVPPWQGDVGVAEPSPGWYPSGAGALQHRSRASGAATQNPLGGRRFSVRENAVPKANKQSWNRFGSGFLKAPFAGWEIQREHPLRAGAGRALLRIYHPTSQFFKGKINEHFIQRIWAAYQEYFQQCTSDTLQIVLTEAKVKCHTLRSDAVCSWKRACTAFRDWQLNPSFFQLPTYGMK